jgi:uncharacterized protein (TIRG00374 family)
MNIAVFNKIVNRLILIIGVGILIHICVLYYTTDNEQWKILTKINYLVLPFLVFLAMCPMLLHSLRIFMWSRFLGYSIKYTECMQVVLANDIGSAAAPTIIGGGPIKLGLLMSKGMPSAESTLLVLLSTIEDLIFYFIGFILALFFFKTKVSLEFNPAQHYQSIITFLVIVCLIYFFKKNILGFLLNILGKINPNWPIKIAQWKNNFHEFKNRITNTTLYIFSHGKINLLISVCILIMQWIAKFTILCLLFMNL